MRAVVEYDGTQFYGFQRQPAVRSVAAVLEDALAEVFGERIAVTGAGRTDSGVHASGQVISCVLPRPFPIDRLSLALNHALPDDVSVRDVETVDPAFSARFSARRRTYVYALLSRPEPSALLVRYAWHVNRPLELVPMQRAAAHLVGEHDFRSFCGVLPEKGGTVRRVSRLTVERRGELLRFEITAGGFLHHMVRTIVGTLVACGRGKRDPDSLPEVLAARDRAAAAPTAPSCGLYLAGVSYDDGYDSFREPPVFAGG